MVTIKDKRIEFSEDFEVSGFKVMQGEEIKFDVPSQENKGFLENVELSGTFTVIPYLGEVEFEGEEFTI